jgi:hypothetical protein
MIGPRKDVQLDENVIKKMSSELKMFLTGTDIDDFDFEKYFNKFFDVPWAKEEKKVVSKKKKDSTK